MNLQEAARQAYAEHLADNERRQSEERQAQRERDERQLRERLEKLGIERPVILIETQPDGSYAMRAEVDGIRFTLETIDGVTEVVASVPCGQHSPLFHFTVLEAPQTRESLLLALGAMLDQSCLRGDRALPF